MVGSINDVAKLIEDLLSRVEFSISVSYNGLYPFNNAISSEENAVTNEI